MTRRDYARMRMDSRRGDMARGSRGGRRGDRRMDGHYMGEYGSRGDYRRYDYPDRERMERTRDRDYTGDMEFSGNVEYDGKRGVKGTGMYGIGGSRYYGRDRARGDYTDDDYDMDYAMWDMADVDSERLSRQDLKEWKKHLENADGTLGEKWSKDMILNLAEKEGVRYKDYDEDEFCFVVNMLYSDFCEAVKGTIIPEKCAQHFVKMAKAWLEDDDIPYEGWEKLARYYDYIAN